MTESKSKARSYYTVEMMLDEHYMQFPKWLMYDPTFASLSNDAKVLYMLLKDRFRLSAKNHWYDKEGRVFVICSRQHMQKLLNKSENTIKKIMNELVDEKIGLIEEKRNKQSNNYIYLLMPKFQNYDDPDLDEDDLPFDYEDEDETMTAEKEENSKNRKICGSRKNTGVEGDSRTAKFEVLQDPQNLRPNKNKFSKEELVSINSLNNNSIAKADTIVYQNEDDLSVVVNKDIFIDDSSDGIDSIVLKQKKRKDFDLYKKYHKKNPYLPLIMQKYAADDFRMMLAYWPDISHTEKIEQLLIDTLCNPRFKDRQNQILKLEEEKTKELYRVCQELYDPEQSPSVHKSKKAYMIGVVENILYQQA